MACDCSGRVVDSIEFVGAPPRIDLRLDVVCLERRDLHGSNYGFMGLHERSIYIDCSAAAAKFSCLSAGHFDFGCCSFLHLANQAISDGDEQPKGAIHLERPIR